MPQEFSYKSTVKNIQSRLVSQSIRETANLDFLKSEDALREVIKSYQEKFRAAKGMLFDASKFVVESADLIKVDDFNEMFESLFIDMSALYNDLDLVDKILKLNLGRNKNYFLVIKKRLRDLWNKLHLTRLLVYDENPSDESYYESFFTKINAKKLQDITVDKKNGVLHLVPEFVRTHTTSSIVKNVTSTTYPEHNDYGGVRYTGSELNSYEDNYSNGKRDMLDNGLWKEQILCNEIPDIVVNIGSSETPIKRNYKGVVSLIDIEYVYPVEINRLDFDVFGDLITSIDAVLYKSNDNQNWQLASIQQPNRIPLDSKYTSRQGHPVRGDAFDIISFLNISKIKAKHLRIVLNQENYIFLDSKDIEKKTVDEKIQEDLSERRYDLVKFGSDLDDVLSKPVNDENQSLYFRLIDIIETTISLEEILDKIDNILNPKVEVVAYDYERTAKFEIGAWSIEPKIEKYTKSIGRFDSMPYSLKDRPLTSVSIIANQTVPKSTTANWYIGVGGKDIPVVENNNILRKEPLYPVDMSQFPQFADWTAGTFYLLDFPVDTILYESMYISVNGSSFVPITEYGRVAFLNSRLIYIDAISDPFEALYTIQYPIALRSAINLYALKAKPGTAAPESVTLDIVASRYEVLKALIKEPQWQSLTESNDSNEKLILDDMYSITSVVSTLDEAKLWFGDEFNLCVFVSNTISNHFTGNINSSSFSQIAGGGDSKTNLKYSDVSLYTNYQSESGFSDLGLIGTIPNIAPLSITRSI